MEKRTGIRVVKIRQPEERRDTEVKKKDFYERKEGRYMDQKMNFKYFYGTEADQFSFYRIPKALFTNDCFKDLSSDAKILYGLMLDRMSLSI